MIHGHSVCCQNAGPTDAPAISQTSQFHSRSKDSTSRLGGVPALLGARCGEHSVRTECLPELAEYPAEIIIKVLLDGARGLVYVVSQIAQPASAGESLVHAVQGVTVPPGIGPFSGTNPCPMNTD